MRRTNVSFLALLLSLTLLSAPVLSKRLRRFGSCMGLNRYYVTNALSRVGPYGLGDRPFFFPPFRREGGGPQPQNAPAPADDTPVAGDDFSTTNVQVEGVDEPDIVKTDGKRVFIIRGSTFHLVRASVDGSSGKRVGTLMLPSHAEAMLFQGDYVLVIGRNYKTIFPRSVARSFISRPFGKTKVQTIVYQIRIAGDTPKLVGTVRMDGNYVSAREVHGVARIIMTYDPTSAFSFVYPSEKFTSDQAIAQNKKIIFTAKPEIWLPKYEIETKSCSAIDRCASSISFGPLASCRNMYRPSGTFTGFKQLIVATMPVTGFIRPRNSVSITSDADKVYSTATSMYVTTTDYQGDFLGFETDLRWGRQFHTSVHKFELSQNRAKYVASGEVSGSVLNQFSMHEYRGKFFVATTDGAPWWGSRDVSKSKVTSFKKAVRRTLKQIGVVGNLGVGERIYSVRYIQDTAYVVTFRQVDPLYIIDLYNPWKLVVTGELKIPGFSSYLHPVSPGRILGVGQEATLEGRTTGAKVTLFDVSNKRKPSELATWTLKGSYTSAQWDHRAFLYWKAEKIAAMPISVYDGATRFTGSIVLNIYNKITERGRIIHSPCCDSKYIPGIERNFVLGKTHLWSLSSQLLQVNAISSLKYESDVSLEV